MSNVVDDFTEYAKSMGRLGDAYEYMARCAEAGFDRKFNAKPDVPDDLDAERAQSVCDALYMDGVWKSIGR